MSEQEQAPALGEPTEVRAGTTVDATASGSTDEGQDASRPDDGGQRTTPTGTAARFEEADMQGGTGGLNAGGAG